MPFPRFRSRSRYADESPERPSRRRNTYGSQYFPASSNRSSPRNSYYPPRSSNYYYTTPHSYCSRNSSRYTDFEPSRRTDAELFRRASVRSPPRRLSSPWRNGSNIRPSTDRNRLSNLELLSRLATLPRSSSSRSSRRADRGSPPPTVSSSSRSRSRPAYSVFSNPSDFLGGIGTTFQPSSRSQRSSSRSYSLSSNYHDRSRSRGRGLPSISPHRSRYPSQERDTYRYSPQLSGNRGRRGRQ